MSVRWLRLLGLLLLLGPFRTVVGQRAASGDVITTETLRLLFSAIPWDSLCGAHCGTVVVDSVIVYASAPGAYPNNARSYHVYHVIAGQERRAADAIAFPVVWAGYADGHRGDTSQVIMTRQVILTHQGAPSEPAAERFFLNILLPHNAYVEDYTVRLERRGERWVVIREGRSQG